MPSYTNRANRPEQRTFRCQVCGFETHADHNGSVNVALRKDDKALRACKDRKAIKTLLMKRHEAWKQQHDMERDQTTNRKRRGKGAEEQKRNGTSRKIRLSSKPALSSLVIPMLV